MAPVETGAILSKIEGHPLLNLTAFAEMARYANFIMKYISPFVSLENRHKAER